MEGSTIGILSDRQIRAEKIVSPCEEGIKRPGVISYGLSSFGYDARIGYKFRVFKTYPCSTIDPKDFDQRMLESVDLTPAHDHKWGKHPLDKEDHFDYCPVCGAWKDTPSEKSYQCPTRVPDHIIIPPHSFVLGETVEEFDIPRDVLCIVVGKSTLARCGLIVNVTPLEPEWKGKVTVEISNTTPLPAKVYCGEGIMQCCFFRADHPDGCETSYADKAGKYQDQTGIKLPEVDKK